MLSVEDWEFECPADSIDDEESNVRDHGRFAEGY